MAYSLVGAESKTHLKIVMMAFIFSAVVGLVIYASQTANSAAQSHLAFNQPMGSSEVNSVCRFHAL